MPAKSIYTEPTTGVVYQLYFPKWRHKTYHLYYGESIDHENRKGYNNLIENYIKKYGPPEKRIVFQITLYDRDKVKELIEEVEECFIKEYNTVYPNGLNLNTDGRRGLPCEETKKKMSENHADVSGRNNPNHGNKWNCEQKKKQSNHTSGDNNGMRKNPKIIKEEDTIAKLTNKGMNIPEIMSKTGMSRTNINIRIKSGRRNGKIGYYRKERNKRIIQLHKLGNKPKDIVEKLKKEYPKITIKIVYHVTRKYKLQTL